MKRAVVAAGVAGAVLAGVMGVVAPGGAAAAGGGAGAGAGVGARAKAVVGASVGVEGGRASVHGAARVAYVESLQDDIRFTVHARSVPFSRPVPGIPGGMATDAEGVVKFSHAAPAGSKPVAAEATVDCLVTSGRTATLTAVLKADTPAMPRGTRIGISVQQGGKGEPDRLGFSWGAANVDTGTLDEKGDVTLSRVGTCMAPAPFTTVIKGGFRVVHAELAKFPGTRGAEGTRAAGVQRRG
ncbi:hypothetical protein [Streptomyces sp. NPDC048442]|uniref:hypothetical protein n=1 Tax=Streptomyces sp. NPDC048442 TaxID=3154823 RepID=UPI003418C72B